MATYGAPAGAVTKAPGPSLRLSIILMIIGIVVAVPSLIAGIMPILNTLNSPGFDVPGKATIHLGAGSYELYQRTGSTSIGDSFDDSLPTITPDDVTITGPSGQRIAGTYPT